MIKKGKIVKFWPKLVKIAKFWPKWGKITTFRLESGKMAKSLSKDDEIVKFCQNRVKLQIIGQRG